MPEYLVTFAIDIEAHSPEEAALKMADQLRHGVAEPGGFSVQRMSAGIPVGDVIECDVEANELGTFGVNGYAADTLPGI